MPGGYIAGVDATRDLRVGRCTRRFVADAARMLDGAGYLDQEHAIALRTDTPTRLRSDDARRRGQHRDQQYHLIRGVVAVLFLGATLACATPQSINLWHDHLLDADRAYDHGRYQVARDGYRSLLDEAPKPRLARYIRMRLAQIDAHTGHLDRALQALVELENAPNPEGDEWTSQARFQRAVLLEDIAEDREAAFALYADIVVRYPESAAGLRSLAYVLDAFDDNDDHTGAIEWLSETYPMIETTELADNFLYEMGKRFEAADSPRMAEEMYMQLRIRFRHGPLFDDATWRLAQIAYDEERYDDALAMAEVIAERHDSSWSFGTYDSVLRDDSILLRAQIYEETDQIEAAIDEYHRLLAAFPKYTGRGRISLHRAELIRVHLEDRLRYQMALERMREQMPNSVYTERAVHRLKLLADGVPLDEIPEHPMPRDRPWLDDDDLPLEEVPEAVPDAVDEPPPLEMTQ